MVQLLGTGDQQKIGETVTGRIQAPWDDFLQSSSSCLVGFTSIPLYRAGTIDSLALATFRLPATPPLLDTTQGKEIAVGSAWTTPLSLLEQVQLRGLVQGGLRTPSSNFTGTLTKPCNRKPGRIQQIRAHTSNHSTAVKSPPPSIYNSNPNSTSIESGLLHKHTYKLCLQWVLCIRSNKIYNNKWCQCMDGINKQ